MPYSNLLGVVSLCRTQFLCLCMQYIWMMRYNLFVLSYIRVIRQCIAIKYAPQCYGYDDIYTLFFFVRNWKCSFCHLLWNYVWAAVLVFKLFIKPLFSTICMHLWTGLLKHSICSVTVVELSPVHVLYTISFLYYVYTQQ